MYYLCDNHLIEIKLHFYSIKIKCFLSFDTSPHLLKGNTLHRKLNSMAEWLFTEIQDITFGLKTS